MNSVLFALVLMAEHPLVVVKGLTRDECVAAIEQTVAMRTSGDRFYASLVCVPSRIKSK